MFLQHTGAIIGPNLKLLYVLTTSTVCRNCSCKSAIRYDYSSTGYGKYLNPPFYPPTKKCTSLKVRLLISRNSKCLLHMHMQIALIVHVVQQYRWVRETLSLFHSTHPRYKRAEQTQKALKTASTLLYVKY